MGAAMRYIESTANFFHFARTDRENSLRRSEPASCSVKSLKGDARVVQSHLLDDGYHEWMKGWAQPETTEAMPESVGEIKSASEVWAVDEIKPAREISAVISFEPADCGLNMSDLMAPLFGYDSEFRKEAVEAEEAVEVQETVAAEEAVNHERVNEKPVKEEQKANGPLSYLDWSSDEQNEALQVHSMKNIVLMPGLSQLAGKLTVANAETSSACSDEMEIGQALREMIESSNPANLATAADPAVMRSCRGTIEMVLHPSGRKIVPTYNYCGMLVRVDLSDGAWFERNREGGNWQMLDKSGQDVLDQSILSLTFDKQGNLSFITECGSRTTIFTSGMISVEEPGRRVAV